MIALPWPSSALAGHSDKHYRVMRPIIKRHREWAYAATKAANVTVPPEGDILVIVRFLPPDNRGDRINFPNRMKAYFDGIADALGVNDKRFLPQYLFEQPNQPGEVQVTIAPAPATNTFPYPHRTLAEVDQEGRDAA
jgi:hypothetical protein